MNYMFLIHSHSSSHLICIGSKAHLTYSMPFTLTSQCYLPDPSIGPHIILPFFGIILWHTLLFLWASEQVFKGSKIHISQIDAFQTQSSRHTSLIWWPPDHTLKDTFPMPPLILWLSSHSLASSASICIRSLSLFQTQSPRSSIIRKIRNLLMPLKLLVVTYSGK